MKTLSRLVFPVLICFGLAIACSSQVRSGNAVKVAASVTISRLSTGGFVYQYTAKVRQDSPQPLVSFTVELGIQNPSHQNLFEIGTLGGIHWGGSITIPSVRPSFFKGAEVTWVPLDTLTELADQLKAPASAIGANDSLRVSITTQALPTITRFWAQGWYDPIVEHEYDSLLAIGIPEDSIVKVWHRDSNEGTTIGPQFLSGEFDPISLLDTLVAYKHQAFALGWIKEEGIVTSLDAKLEAARPQIIADRPSAKQILESFVIELDALNTQGNQITNEAYALLKFNAQYLISKL